MQNYEPYGHNFQLSKDTIRETPGFRNIEEIPSMLYPINKICYDAEKSLKIDTGIKPFKAYK